MDFPTDYTYHKNELQCPYCGHWEETADFRDQCYEEEYKCALCEKKYLLTIEIAWEFTATAKK